VAAFYLLASIGIVQNLTSDNFYSSAYLRAHFRKEKGLPLLVEKIADQSRTISNTAIISLRNLAVDLKNKELIGKYGMGEVCANIPDAKQVIFVKQILFVDFIKKLIINLGGCRRQNRVSSFIFGKDACRVSL